MLICRQRSSQHSFFSSINNVEAKNYVSEEKKDRKKKKRKKRNEMNNLNILPRGVSTSTALYSSAGVDAIWIASICSKLPSG